MGKSAQITQARYAGANARGQEHQVVTVEGGEFKHRPEPCPTCPWRVDATGEFPAEAFRHSASTAYDQAQNHFSCHQSGAKKPAVCAGFLLRGAAHNLSVRFKIVMGQYNPDDVSDGGHELHASYKAMAIANGVSPDDPIIQPCREN